MSANMDFLVHSTGPLSSQGLVLQKPEDQEKPSTELGKEGGWLVLSLRYQLGRQTMCFAKSQHQHHTEYLKVGES